MITRLIEYTLVRYVIGGGISASINLFLLYLLNVKFGVYYITASIFAFIVAFFVSLVFHKFWTFRELSTDNIKTQGSVYFLTSLFGLLLNTVILYITVDILKFSVILGQIVAGGLTACCTFFISKHLVFRTVIK